MLIHIQKIGILIGIFIFCMDLVSFSQGTIETPVISIDSSVPAVSIEAKHFSPAVVSGSVYIFNLDIPKMNLPDFNLLNNITGNWKLDYNFLISPGNSNFNRKTFFHTGINGYMPFMQSTIFNQAAYSLNDKFIIGGNSYGINSPLSMPVPDFNNNHYGYKGASMFFQYKVSDKFKIETRINVSGNP